jgi:hypothetical protein
LKDIVSVTTQLAAAINSVALEPIKLHEIEEKKNASSRRFNLLISQKEQNADDERFK